MILLGKKATDNSIVVWFYLFSLFGQKGTVMITRITCLCACFFTWSWVYDQRHDVSHHKSQQSSTDKTTIYVRSSGFLALYYWCSYCCKRWLWRKLTTTTCLTTVVCVLFEESSVFLRIQHKKSTSVVSRVCCMKMQGIHSY